MWADPTLVHRFFKQSTAKGHAHSACGEVMSWLASGDLDPQSLAEITARHGVRREEWFRKEMLDLVLAFLRGAREADGRIPRESLQAGQLLVHALHVREGEFLSWRRAEVTEIVTDQVERLLDDAVVDEREDEYLVELQAVFGIGTDELFAMTKDLFEEAWRRLSDAAQHPNIGYRAIARLKLTALEPLLELGRRSRPY